MKLIFSAALLFVTIGFWSCDGGHPSEQKEDATAQEIDLSSYGLPIKIKTPSASPNITKDEFLGDITLVIVDENYYLQIAMSQVPVKDIQRIKAEALEEVMKLKSEKFSAIIQEDSNGFVYEKTFERDSTKYYDFRYVRVKGEQLYTMSTTTTTKPPHIKTPLSKQQVLKIYGLIKEEKKDMEK